MSSTSFSTSQKPKTKFPLSLIVSLVVMAVLVVGALAALYLSQQNQELRQQASVGVINTAGADTCYSCNTNSDCTSGRCERLSVGYRCVPAAATTLPSCPAVPPGTANPNLGSCSGSCCTITQAGAAAGCTIGLYKCPGGEIPCNIGSGTQLPASGTVCMDNNYCGSQQVDLRCPGQPAQYPAPLPKPASCTPSQPPTQPSTPPGTGGTPTSLPSTSPITPSCQSLQPVDAITLQPLKTMPPVGQQVRFRCAAGLGVNASYYFFAYTNTVGHALDLIYQGPSDLTFPILVEPYMAMQCNPCVGSTCSSAQSVSQNCTFVQNIATSPSPKPSPTPTPSPSPVAVPACNGLTRNFLPIASGVPTGTANYQFTCQGAPGSNYYFFAYRTSPNEGFQLLAQGTSNVATYQLPPTVGYLQVQCNPCIDSVCSPAQDVNQNCTYTENRPTIAPSSSPSPVASIVPGPQCLSITLSNPNAQIGSAVTATCGQVAGAARYISRVMLPDGTVRDLAMTGQVSEPVQITTGGTYLFQCQICTGAAASTCQSYEPTSALWEDPIAPPTGGTN